MRVVMGVALWTAAAAVAAPQPWHPQATLEEAAQGFAARLAQGETGSIGSLMESTGVRFHMAGQSHGALPPRQVVVALKGFLSRYRPGAVAVSRVSEVGGTPAKGFAEITLTTVAEGTSEPIVYTIYTGFTARESGWRVTEVRILR